MMAGITNPSVSWQAGHHVNTSGAWGTHTTELWSRYSWKTALPKPSRCIGNGQNEHCRYRMIRFFPCVSCKVGMTTTISPHQVQVQLPSFVSNMERPAELGFFFSLLIMLNYKMLDSLSKFQTDRDTVRTPDVFFFKSQILCLIY